MHGISVHEHDWGFYWFEVSSNKANSSGSYCKWWIMELRFVIVVITHFILHQATRLLKFISLCLIEDQRFSSIMLQLRFIGLRLIMCLPWSILLQYLMLEFHLKTSPNYLRYKSIPGFDALSLYQARKHLKVWARDQGFTYPSFIN